MDVRCLLGDILHPARLLVIGDSAWQHIRVAPLHVRSARLVQHTTHRVHVESEGGSRVSNEAACEDEDKHIDPNEKDFMCFSL